MMDESFEQYFSGESSGETWSTMHSSQPITAGMSNSSTFIFSKEDKSRKAGRRDTLGTTLLKKVQNKAGRPLKKEYKRCQIIRGMKKMIRQFKKRGFTRKLNETFDFMSVRDGNLMMKMKEIYYANESLFDMISPTTAGPATDGKAHRSSEVSTAQSFNHDFCQRFFSPSCVREFLALMVELVYGLEDDICPAQLCKRLGEYCCRKDTHSANCVQAWTGVRRYVSEVMLEELGLSQFAEKDYEAETDLFLFSEGQS